MAKERKSAIKKLITSVTGIEEGDENFSRSLHYADSNIKYHRYLSPDSHKIQRAVDGLCEKFQVHSKGQKSSDLKELTQQFLDQPGLGGKDEGKTDVHYGMLSLLVDLAGTGPPQQEYERKKPKQVQEEEDDFDWKAYLLDGEDLYFLSHASSESSEEEESLSDEEDEKQAGKGGDKHRVSFVATDGQNSIVERGLEGSQGGGASSLDLSQVTAIPAEDHVMYLEENLVVQYWKGKGVEDTVAGGRHSACSMARNWKSYQQRLEPLLCFPDQILVTETQVIRETLWMLSGVTELFAFVHDDQGFRLNPDIYVTHLTPESLDNSLSILMARAQQILVLDTFVTDGVAQRTNWTSHNSNKGRQTTQETTDMFDVIPPTQTYQAFAACVSEFLTGFRSNLTELEKSVMKQDETMTLMSLTSDLQPWLQKVEAVHRVILHGITSTAVELSSLADGEGEREDRGSNCYKATKLLDTLYQSVFEWDLASLTDNGELASLLLNMLVKSSQPLLQIISDWVNYGRLTDFAGEFVLQRNSSVKSLDDVFWEEAFVSRLPESSPDTSRSKSLNSSSHPRSLVDSDSQMVPCGGPKLLQPILQEAILTGKSMEILESLGRMGEVLSITHDVFHRPPTLYNLFVEDLNKALTGGCDKREEQPAQLAKLDSQTIDGSSHSLAHIREETTSHHIAGVHPHCDATINKQLNLPGVKDSLLNVNFASLFSVERRTAGEPKCPESADCELAPLMSVCRSCLVQHVTARYETVCSRLVTILKKEYRLMDCLHAMQRYYLMSSGDVMYDFYVSVFQKIESGSHWKDRSLLEMFLHEAVEPVSPADISKLSIQIINAPKFQQKSAIEATDCIQLRYSVQSPMNIIISTHCQQLYNEVFCFILQIKRVKYTLDQLRFYDLQVVQAVPASVDEELFLGSGSATRPSRIHQFQLLRFRLLYYINSLHNYIMTRILHSTELEFGHRLETATDLEQIISIHNQYVAAIHERCLLHPRLAMLLKTVGRILNLALTCGTLWRRGVDFTSGDAIQEIDTELTRCVEFLSSVLQTVIKRGSYPHLESLAFSLGSTPQFK